MKRTHKLRLGVSLENVNRHLACEHRPVMRRRLHALQMLVKGATVGRAAKAANVCKMTVEAWLRIVRKWGCSGLLSVEKPYSSQVVTDEAAAREQIRIALESKVSLRLRKRLVAIDRLLAGQRPEQVAEEMRVQSGTLKLWVDEVRKTGLSEILRWSDLNERDSRNRQLAPSLARTFTPYSKSDAS
jgi:transposase